MKVRGRPPKNKRPAQLDLTTEEPATKKPKKVNLAFTTPRKPAPKKAKATPKAASAKSTPKKTKEIKDPPKIRGMGAEMIESSCDFGNLEIGQQPKLVSVTPNRSKTTNTYTWTYKDRETLFVCASTNKPVIDFHQLTWSCSCGRSTKSKGCKHIYQALEPLTDYNWEKYQPDERRVYLVISYADADCASYYRTPDNQDYKIHGIYGSVKQAERQVKHIKETEYGDRDGQWEDDRYYHLNESHPDEAGATGYVVEWIDHIVLPPPPDDSEEPGSSDEEMGSEDSGENSNSEESD